MKSELLYTFFKDENVNEKILNDIFPKLSSTNCNVIELTGVSIEDQLNSDRWVDIHIGKFTIVFFMKEKYVGIHDDDVDYEVCKMHIIVRDLTEKELKDTAAS